VGGEVKRKRLCRFRFTLLFKHRCHPERSEGSVCYCLELVLSNNAVRNIKVINKVFFLLTIIYEKRGLSVIGVNGELKIEN
jgi:hypothetical protein